MYVCMYVFKSSGDVRGILYMYVCVSNVCMYVFMSSGDVRGIL